MSRINLLPPEVLAGRKARQEGKLLKYVFGGVVFVLALVWFSLHLQLNQQRERLALAQAQAQSIQVKINALQRFALLEESIKTRVSTLSGAMNNDIGWSRLLRDVSSLIPANSWLTAFTGTADEGASGAAAPAAPAAGGTPPAGTASPPAAAGGTPPAGTASPPGAAGTTGAGTPPGAVPAAPLSPGAATAAGTLPPRLGTLSFTVITFDFPGVAKWLTTLEEELESVQNIFVPTAAKEELGGREVVNFTSTADLSQAARSGRYQMRQP